MVEIFHASRFHGFLLSTFAEVGFLHTGQKGKGRIEYLYSHVGLR
jgi:hypothetical protein